MKEEDSQIKLFRNPPIHESATVQRPRWKGYGVELALAFCNAHRRHPDYLGADS